MEIVDHVLAQAATAAALRSRSRPSGTGADSLPRIATSARTPTKIRQRLEELSPIGKVQVNILTQNVLLHYDQADVSAQDVLEMAELVVGSYSLTAYKAERAEQNRPTVNERRLQEGSLSEMLVRIGVTTATLGFYFFRKPMGHGPATLSGRF